MKRLLLGALLVILLACAYSFGGHFFEATKETSTAPRPPPVQGVMADVAIEMPAPIQITTIGTVQSISTVIIKSRVDGEIAKVHFEEVQEVNEGDLLFTLDNR